MCGIYGHLFKSPAVDAIGNLRGLLCSIILHAICDCVDKSCATAHIIAIAQLHISGFLTFDCFMHVTKKTKAHSWKVQFCKRGMFRLLQTRQRDRRDFGRYIGVSWNSFSFEVGGQCHSSQAWCFASYFLCVLLALNTLLKAKQNAKYNFELPGQDCEFQFSNLSSN